MGICLLSMCGAGTMHSCLSFAEGLAEMIKSIEGVNKTKSMASRKSPTAITDAIFSTDWEVYTFLYGKKTVKSNKGWAPNLQKKGELMKQKTRLMITLGFLLVLLGTVTSAEAFTPHADCTFRERPLPLVRDCGDKVDDVLYWKNKIAGIQRALDALGGLIDDAAERQLREGFGDVMDFLNPIPNSAAGLTNCWLDYCREGLGQAVGALTAVLSITDTFAENLRNIKAYNDWLSKLRDAKEGLDAANKAADECLQAQAKEAKDYEDAKAYNKAGVPLYPADHPLCNPPKEDADTLTNGGGDDDPSLEVGQGHKDESGSKGTKDSSEPDWSRVEDFTRIEVQRALDWINSELDICGQFAEYDRGGCVNASLAHRNHLKATINKGINTSTTASKRLEWIQTRDQLNTIKQRGSEMTKK